MITTWWTSFHRKCFWVPERLHTENVRYFKLRLNSVHGFVKELSFCHKLWFSNPYMFKTQCCRPLKFQTMKSVRLNNLSLKYQISIRLSKEIGIRKLALVANTQFLFAQTSSKFGQTMATHCSFLSEYRTTYQIDYYVH